MSFDVFTRVDDNKSCSVWIVGCDKEVVGLTPEQATYVKEMLQLAYRRGKRAAYQRMSDEINRIKCGDEPQ